MRATTIGPIQSPTGTTRSSECPSFAIAWWSFAPTNSWTGCGPLASTTATGATDGFSSGRAGIAIGRTAAAAPGATKSAAK